MPRLLAENDNLHMRPKEMRPVLDRHDTGQSCKCPNTIARKHSKSLYVWGDVYKVIICIVRLPVNINLYTFNIGSDYHLETVQCPKLPNISPDWLEFFK